MYFVGRGESRYHNITINSPELYNYDNIYIILAERKYILGKQKKIAVRLNPFAPAFTAVSPRERAEKSSCAGAKESGPPSLPAKKQSRNVFDFIHDALVAHWYDQSNPEIT